MLFTLSKINMLILVTALFTIIVYFTFSFQGMLVSVSAGQEVGKVLEQAAYLINSRDICGKIEVSIPEKIETATGQGVSFVLEIRKVQLSDMNSLVFSVINKDEWFHAKRQHREPTIIASDRMNLKASFHVFSLDEEDNLCPADSAFLGLGLRALPIDNVVIVKEVHGGKRHVYIIPCTSSNELSCKENAERVACWIREQRGGTPSADSYCFDTPDTCPSPALQGCGGTP